jgi:cytochrome c peroxidase
MKLWTFGVWLLSGGLSACHLPDDRALAAPARNPAIFSLSTPLGLPPVPLPEGDPLTQARVDLGRKLFMDRRLSHNNTLSCAMCHVPEQGFTSNELGTAIGLEGRSLRRNAPTILNVAYVEQLFDDGREFSLENQVWGPLLALNEMAVPSIGYLIEKIRIMPDYKGLFEAAFAGRGPTMETIGAALASYERTLVSGNSRFDRWYFGNDRNALDSLEQAGFKIFSGKGGCAACHSVGEKSALFTDNRFHNTGIGWARSMTEKGVKHTVQLAPGVFVQVEDSVLKSVSEPRQGDVGRYEVTLDPADSWAYRTPTLRNVALTEPYMHDGSLATLQQVIDFYDRGGIDNPHKDPLLKPLHLTAAEKQQLVAFLGALTGDNVKQLEANARAERIDRKIPDIDPAAQYKPMPPRPSS